MGCKLVKEDIDRVYLPNVKHENKEELTSSPDTQEEYVIIRAPADLQLFKPKTETFENFCCEKLILPEAGMCSVEKDSLLVCGGVDFYGEESSSCFFIDLSNGSLVDLPSMPACKRRLRLVYSPNTGSAFALGGVRQVLKNKSYEIDYSCSCLEFNFKTQTWKVHEEMPLPVEFSGAFLNNSEIWVTGGANENTDSWLQDSVQVLNIYHKIWRTLDLKLPVKLYMHLTYRLDPFNFLILGGVDEEQYEAGFIFHCSKANYSEVAKFPSGLSTAFPHYLIPHENFLYCPNEFGKVFCFNTETKEVHIC